MLKSCLSLCLALAAAGSFYGQQAVRGNLVSPDPIPAKDSLRGSYSVVAQPYDWGVSLSKAVLHLEEPVREASPEQFLVVEEKASAQRPVDRALRTVTHAYPSDEAGCEVSGSSEYVTLELAVSPETGALLRPQADSPLSLQADPYRLVIELQEDTALRTTRGRYTDLAIARTPTGRTLEGVEQFTAARSGPLTYASYQPPQSDSLRPLVIWLHGLGEGGTDPRLPLLGNKSSVFAGELFQTLSGGAYVLVPQCPTFWLDDGTGNTTTDGSSAYT